LSHDEILTNGFLCVIKKRIFWEKITRFRSLDDFSSPRNIRTIRRRQDSLAGRGGRAAAARDGARARPEIG
jgi:hypothetical protein